MSIRPENMRQNRPNVDTLWGELVGVVDSLDDDSPQRATKILKNIAETQSRLDGQAHLGRWDGRLVDYAVDSDAFEIHGLTYLLSRETTNETVGQRVVAYVVGVLTTLGRYDVLGSHEFRTKLDTYIESFGHESNSVAWAAVRGWIWEVGEASQSDRNVLWGVTREPAKWYPTYAMTMDVFARLADLSRTVNLPTHTMEQREECLQSLLSLTFFDDVDGVLCNPPRTMREDPTRLHYLRRMLLSIPSLDEKTTLYFMDVARGDVSRSENGTLPAWLRIVVSRSLPVVSNDGPATARLHARADELIKHGWPSPPAVSHSRNTYKEESLRDNLRYASGVQRELLYKARLGQLRANFAAEYPLWIFKNTVFTTLLQQVIDENHVW